MKDVLIVVDMQKDFVDGALGTAEAVSIVSNVAARIERGIANNETILFTRDTHETQYMETQEGHNLPVPHCICGTEGWEIIPQQRLFTDGRVVIDKPTFGSTELGEAMVTLNQETPIGKITLIGLCTDICVISNALLVKAFLPEIPMTVDASCCAGVTPESHKNALSAMKMCQISVENES